MENHNELARSLSKVAMESGNPALEIAGSIYEIIDFFLTDRKTEEAPVTQEQIKELQHAIDQLRQDLDQQREEILLILNTSTLTDIAADVFGIEQAIKYYSDTGNSTAVKGALALTESVSYRFQKIWENKPSYLSDATIVTLATLYIPFVNYRLFIHIINNLQQWTPKNAKILLDTFPKFMNILHEAMLNLAKLDYTPCFGKPEIIHSPGAPGEPNFTTTRREYGIRHLNNGSCEIIGIASWTVGTIGSTDMSGMIDADKKISAEIHERVEVEVNNKISKYQDFYRKLKKK